MESMQLIFTLKTQAQERQFLFHDLHKHFHIILHFTALPQFLAVGKGRYTHH